MLIDGLTIMIIGMLVVFSFLILLVFVMNISSYILKIFGKHFPEEIQEQSKAQIAIERNEDIALVVAAVKAYIEG